MLRFFRINDPYRLVIIFILMIGIRSIQGYFIDDTSYYELKWLLLGKWLDSGFQMYSETFDYTGPIAALVYSYLSSIFGQSTFIHYGFSSILIIFQASIFNQLLLKNKAYNENSYLPAFLYMILLVSVPDYMTLSPQLMSLTFILLTLKNVLRRINNLVTDELFISSGIYIGVATMIYFPSIIFFVVFLLSFILFSSSISRRLFLYLLSFLLVLTIVGLYFYWKRDFNSFIDSYFIQNVIMSKYYILNFQEIILICAGFILIFLFSAFKIWKSARLTIFQQKIKQVIWLMFLGGVFTFFLSNEKSLHELLFVVPTVTFLWTHYFILLKKRIFKTVMPSFMILGLLFYSIYSYRHYLSPLTIDKIKNTNEKTMIFGENLSYYYKSEILTPCFDSHLTTRAFDGLDYYNSASRLYTIFDTANPTYLIDEINVAEKFFLRFPAIKKSYKKINFNTYQKINN